MAVVSELKDLLKAPKDVVKAVQTLLDERSALQKQIEVLQNEKVQQLKNGLLDKVEVVNRNGGPVHSRLVEKVDVPSADALKQLAYDLKAKVDNLAVVLGADINGKPQLAVMLPDSLIQGRNLNAGQVVKELAKNIKGGGVVSRSSPQQAALIHRAGCCPGAGKRTVGVKKMDNIFNFPEAQNFREVLF